MFRAVSRALVWIGSRGGLLGSTPSKNEVSARSCLPVLSDLRLFADLLLMLATSQQYCAVLIDLIAGLATQEPSGQYRGRNRGAQSVSQRNQSVGFRQPQSLSHRVVPGPKKASRRALVVAAAA